MSSLIFRAVDKAPEVIGEPKDIYLGKNGVAWVLRFGGLCAIVICSQFVTVVLYLARSFTVWSISYSHNTANQAGAANASAIATDETSKRYALVSHTGCFSS